MRDRTHLFLCSSQACPQASYATSFAQNGRHSCGFMFNIPPAALRHMFGLFEKSSIPMLHRGLINYDYLGISRSARARSATNSESYSYATRWMKPCFEQDASRLPRHGRRKANEARPREPQCGPLILRRPQLERVAVAAGISVTPCCGFASCRIQFGEVRLTTEQKVRLGTGLSALQCLHPFCRGVERVSTPLSEAPFLGATRVKHEHALCNWTMEFFKAC